MKRLILIVLFLLSLGCGSSEQAPTPSLFKGTWEGHWSDLSGQSGDLNLIIHANGLGIGQITNVTTGEYGNVSGTIKEDGISSFTYYYLYTSSTYTTDPPTLYKIVGIASINNNMLINIADEYSDDVLISTLTFTLIKQ